MLSSKTCLIAQVGYLLYNSIPVGVKNLVSRLFMYVFNYDLFRDISLHISQENHFLQVKN